MYFIEVSLFQRMLKRKWPNAGGVAQIKRPYCIDQDSTVTIVIKLYSFEVSVFKHFGFFFFKSDLDSLSC